MKVKTYASVQAFLEDTRAALELNEAANNLMLGVCERLARHPERIEVPPCLATVADLCGLVLAAVMTPPHNLVAYGYRGDLEEGARALVEDLVREGWQVPGVLGPRGIAQRVAERWAEVTGSRCDLVCRQRVYELREVISPQPAGGALRQAVEADVELVAGWRHAFQAGIFGQADPERAAQAARVGIEDGDIYLWEEGQPVSMAMKARPTRHGISVTLVYTPPELRGRGYATACVGELSRLLLEEGRSFCSLFADLENPAANRVYRRIGYRPVCDYDEYAFSKEA